MNEMMVLTGAWLHLFALDARRSTGFASMRHATSCWRGVDPSALLGRIIVIGVIGRVAL